MHWYDYLTCFAAGMFLANFVPHFVNGISGNRFPTPFANPPGKGLSSPLVNTLWGLFNLAVGALFIYNSKAASGGWPAALAIFAGIALLSTLMSVRFASKHTE